MLFWKIIVFFGLCVNYILGQYFFPESTRECILQGLPHPDCRGIEYQSLDGSCNNPLIPFGGKSQTPYKRLLPPNYGNGLDTPRLSSNGSALPLSRVISNVFNSRESNDNSNTTQVNAMFVQFGQFLIHDLAGTPLVAENNCNCSGLSLNCLTIKIPPGDPFYPEELSCFNRKGSIRAPGCEQLPAEQVNRLSAFIDAENIYGWNEKLLEQLRDPNSDYGGLLLIDTTNENNTGHSGVNDRTNLDCPVHRNKKLLQSLKNLKPELASIFDCPPDQHSPICFASGDNRVNENIGLSSTHLVFTREHNRIAKRLKTLNNHWDSDKCFYEARKIMIATMQMITYGEFLPLLVGPKLMKEFNLEIVQNGFYYGYDATFDATISNEFGVAAFRYGHSQVGDFFHRLQSDYEQEAEPAIPMFESLFFQEAVLNGTTPSIMRGLMMDPAKITDLHFVPDIRNKMFQTATFPGQDLLAINIQRGRAHGIPSYNDYRDFCGLPRAFDWSDFNDTIPQNTLETIQSLYNDVNDVDLYIGAIAETPLGQANVGPTFGCIIAYQFRDLRNGDRYWFENPGQFNEDQLNEIRSTTFSSILCNNMDGMITISPRAMELVGESNARINCSQVSRMNLESFREYKHKQDGEWTRWFPTTENMEDTVLQKILINEPDSACVNPLNVQMEILHKQSMIKKVRYRCPKGSIRSTTYPNVKDNLHYSWTAWFNQDNPKSDGSDFESKQNLLKTRPNELCDNPLYMQAISNDGVSAHDSEEIFLYLSAKKGLACRGSDQPNGICKDYRVRFYCPNGIGRKNNFSNSILPQWTEWINMDNPNRNGGDIETLTMARKNNFTICRNPLLMEGRVVGNNIPALKTNDTLILFNENKGLICLNDEQTDGLCQDYEVRYLCSDHSLH